MKPIACLLALFFALPTFLTAAPGLIAEYFRLQEKLGDEFEVPVGQEPWLVRVDKDVNFPEVAGQFYRSKLADGFMVRWTGTLIVKQAGQYVFSTTSDDGSRLSIDGKMVVDNWGPHSMTRKSATVSLPAGTHAIKIIFQEGGGGAGCIASWKPPGGKEVPIPASALSHDPARLKAIRWDRKAFARAEGEPASPAKSAEPVSGTLPEKFGNFMGTAVRLGRDSEGDNVAFRAQIIRLNPEGSACVVFDADTMRLAAGWTQGGLKLEGLPFTGGHGSFPSFNGEAVFKNRAAPGWADAQGSFAEPRVPEDGAYPPLGPLPRSQAHYEGVSPTGQLTSGDNEGTFVPRCPIHWIDQGEFLGVVDSAADYAKMKTTPTVKQRRGDRKQHLEPSEQPIPLAWLPKSVDNSNGGQVWVTSDKWGPFQGEMLHMSYGQSSLYVVLKQKCGDIVQGGVVKIPVRPTSSAMRGKFNAKDGQLYIAGLKGWQSNAGREGGLDRVRYTGRPVLLPRTLKVRDGGIEIGFTRKLDKKLAEDPESYSISGSDLRWTHAYGTGEFQVGHRDSADPPKGRTKFTVKSAKLLEDGQSVFLEVEDLQPVHMMQIDIDLETKDGEEIVTKVWNTIHQVE